MSDNLQQLSEVEVSIWLDDLSRERIETGNLADLIRDDHVVGVTTNPSIFSNALSEGERYDAQVRQLVADGADISRVVEELTTTDVRNACDILAPVAKATDEVDGRVSIEVEPGLAHDTDGTIAQAAELWRKVDRENLFIKIPGTAEGCPAIAATGPSCGRATRTRCSRSWRAVPSSTPAAARSCAVSAHPTPTSPAPKARAWALASPTRVTSTATASATSSRARPTSSSATSGAAAPS